MLFNLISYIFGVKTKYILDTKTSEHRKSIKLSMSRLEVVKIWVFNICKVTTTDNEVSYGLVDDFMLSETKNELYYKFIGKLLLFTREVQLDGEYYVVSKFLGVLPEREDLIILDGFILSRDKTIMYGIVSKDIGSRKLYKKLTTIRKEIN